MGDDITQEATSKNCYQNGTAARVFESLAPIFALFEDHNIKILEASKPGESTPNLYITWNDLRPPLLGKAACYSRKNVLEPIGDAFGKPFPDHPIAGPGTQQLLLASLGDDASIKWSNLGNCSKGTLQKKKKLQKWSRQQTAGGERKMSEIAATVKQRMPQTVSFVAMEKRSVMALPAYLTELVKVQEQICQMRHGFSMVFKGAPHQRSIFIHVSSICWVNAPGARKSLMTRPAKLMMPCPWTYVDGERPFP